MEIITKIANLKHLLTFWQKFNANAVFFSKR